MTVYGYIRVSTVNQAREGDSLEAQRRQVQSYAISRGLELPHYGVFVEAGVSGSVEFQKRPEGSRLLQGLKAGDVVIFPKLDRAFRNTRDALNVLHLWKEKGVSAHFIDLGGDVTGNGIGAIVFTILSAFATFERERIGARIKEVKQMKKAQGLYVGGRRPFGYDIVEGRRVPNAAEQQVIAEMVEMRKAGASYRSISEVLTSRGAPALTFMGVKAVLGRLNETMSAN